MLKQPLTISLNEEDDEVCLQLFYTLLLHAGKITLLSRECIIIYNRDHTF